MSNNTPAEFVSLALSAAGFKTWREATPDQKDRYTSFACISLSTSEDMQNRLNAGICMTDVLDEFELDESRNSRPNQ